jgi:hypothetical protein
LMTRLHPAGTETLAPKFRRACSWVQPFRKDNSLPVRLATLLSERRVRPLVPGAILWQET